MVHPKYRGDIEGHEVLSGELMPDYNVPEADYKEAMGKWFANGAEISTYKDLTGD